MAAALGSLVVSLSANTAEFTKGMDKAAYQTEQAMKKMQADAKMVGVALGAMAVSAAAAMVVMTRHAMDAADALGKMSEKTGVAVNQLAGLQLAAGMAGVNADALGGGLTKLNKSIAEAASGNKMTAAAFDAMGISVTDATGKTKTADVVFKEMSGKFEGYANGAEKVALAQAVMGKSGADMIVLLNGGAKAMQELSDYSEKYSGVTEELVKQSTVFNDTLSLLEVHQKSLGNVLAAAVLPIIQAIADETLRASEESNKFAMAAAAVRTVLQTLVVVGSEVVYTFQRIGNTLGGMAAQVASLGIGFQDLAAGPVGIGIALGKAAISGEMSLGRFKSINKMIIEDDKKALADHNAFLARVLAPPVSVVTPDGKPAPKKPNAPRLPGADGGKGKDTFAQEAKAQLTADLDALKKASEVVTDQYASAEKIMQAMRSANLVSDKDFYTSKLGFLRLNGQAQETELQAEIARMRQEQLTGKAKIDNDRKILDAQSKLKKLRAEVVAGAVINGIEEAAANDKIARSYIDATTAAQAYIDTVNRQNARELGGLGKGSQFRSDQSGINAIEDKQTTERQALERDKRNGKITEDQFNRYLAIVNDTYDKEVQAYNASRAAIKAAQGDWVLGASEAINNYMDSANNTAAQIENSTVKAFKGMEDAMVQFAMTGKLSFADMARSIIADLIRIQAQKAIAGFGSMVLGMMTGTPALAGARAEGGPVWSGASFLVGEKGPEIFTPSTAGTIIPNGASGGGTVNVTQNFTVGDVASISMVRQAVAGSESRIASAMGRSQRYGGQLA